LIEEDNMAGKMKKLAILIIFTILVMFALNGCFLFKMYEITFINDLKWNNYETSVDISIDGKYIDTLNTYEETTIKLVKGDHSITLDVYRKYDSHYITTKSDSFYVVGDETVELYDDFFASPEFSSGQ
jgi:hypothetical protein